MTLHANRVLKTLTLAAILGLAMTQGDPELTEATPPDSGGDRVTYQGSQVISICHDTSPKFKEVTEPLINDKALEYWGRNNSCCQYFVASEKVAGVKAKISEAGLPFEVLIEDLQRAIDTENPPPAEDEDEEQSGKIGHEGLIIKPLLTILLNRHKNKPWALLTLIASATSSLSNASSSHASTSISASSNTSPFISTSSNMSTFLNSSTSGSLSSASYVKLGHRMDWASYHRVNDIYGYLDHLGQTYPELVTVGTLGSSIEGRPLKYIKISSGKPNARSFWIDGGIHAREWISPATVTYILYELVENREAHLSQVDGIDFYILPVMNPDGYEYTHMRDRLWRKNRSKGGYYCQGTDLNRNWGYKWGGKGSSNQQCQEIYGGRSAFSEPETRAVSNFIQSSIPNAKGFLTFHSYGQYILYPYGFDTNQLPPDHQDLERVGRKMAQAIRQVGGSQYTVGNSANSLYPAAGGADDWAKGVAKIKYSFTIELRDKGRYGFVLPAQFILPTAKEALAAVKVISSEIKALPN